MAAPIPAHNEETLQERPQETPHERPQERQQSRPQGRQLGLYERVLLRAREVTPLPPPPLCAGCQAKEARYGFKEGERPHRPRTLCFDCFRMELEYRRRVTLQLARGWNARQPRLPLADTLEDIARRRRRAQIVARYVSGE